MTCVLTKEGQILAVALHAAEERELDLIAKTGRLEAEIRKVRSLVALHQQNGCGVQLMREGDHIDGSPDA